MSWRLPDSARGQGLVNTLICVAVDNILEFSPEDSPAVWGWAPYEMEAASGHSLINTLIYSSRTRHCNHSAF